MPAYDLQEPTTLFECVDPVDRELHGQPLERGPLGELVTVAMGWFDGRLDGARIVSASHAEYRATDIRGIYRELADQ